MLLAAAVAGCSFVDLYSGRATVYNVESEQAHDQGVLLNIVRASLRRPRAYTLVQKITGQASATGGFNLSFPFGPHATGPNTGMLNASANGGPNFEVATLETNDFFNGLVLPIPAPLFDLYIHGEFPRDLLFNLFIEKIVMRKADGECAPVDHLPRCEIVFQNYPGVDLQRELFQALAGYLVDLNLSTEQIEDKKAGAQQDKPKPGGNNKDDTSKDKTQTPSISYVFCFAPRSPETARLVEANARCGTGDKKRKTDPGKTTLGRVSTIEGVTISSDLGRVFSEIIRDRAATPDLVSGFEQIRSFTGRRVALTIYTRSTETATYYVGELVRRQLYPDLETVPQVVQFKTGLPFSPFPLRPCSIERVPRGGQWSCANLFVLDINAGEKFNTGFSVYYEGTQYSVPSEPGAGANYQTRAGGSYTVLSVLRQLVILNTNAKSLPATSVLAITTQ